MYVSRATLTVCLLLKYGARADVSDSHDNTALHLMAIVGGKESREPKSQISEGGGAMTQLVGGFLTSFFVIS